MNDPPAPDLGASRARMDPLIETLAFLIGNSAALDLKALVTAYDAQAARLAAVEQDRDDFRDSTYEMLGELLAAHEITPEPCPGGPCVANALLAIGHALAAAEAERDQQTALVRRWDERDHAKTVQLARLERERDQLALQIDRLANFIMREVPGEPSQSEGAVDTAIRLLGLMGRKDAKNATIEPTA